MGNHEQMLYDALNEFRTTHGESRIDREILFCNGGRPTFHDAMRHFNHSMVNKIGLLPYWKTYTNKNGKNIILTHAGFTPIVKDEYPEKEILIWSRLHFTNRWREGFEDTIIVHGHTPCEYLIDDISMDRWAGRSALWYCDNHKVCIDMLTCVNNYALLLDLDTFEEFIIEA